MILEIRGHGIATSGFSGSIGGSTPSDANLISGNDGDGIAFANSNSNLVLGNFIGTAANGTSALGNSGNGISFTGGGSVFNTLGGTQSADRNVIAFNGGDGVQLSDAGVSNGIRGNSIFSNGTSASNLGIDLGPDGVNPNDAKDADCGPNGLQNFPVITSALVTGSTKTIKGLLIRWSATPSTSTSMPVPPATPRAMAKDRLISVQSPPARQTAMAMSFIFHPDASHAACMTVGKVITATATSTGAFCDVGFSAASPWRMDRRAPETFSSLPRLTPSARPAGGGNHSCPRRWQQWLGHRDVLYQQRHREGSGRLHGRDKLPDYLCRRRNRDQDGDRYDQ